MGMTVLAALMLMAAYFLLLYAGVGLIQEKRFFGSAPKVVFDAVPERKEERFRGPQLPPRLRQHFYGKVRRGQPSAPRRDRAGEQTRPAGALQHFVVRADLLRHGGTERAVGGSIDAVRKNIVDPCHIVPKHGFLLRVGHAQRTHSAMSPASTAAMTAMPSVPNSHFLRLAAALIYGFRSSVPGIVQAFVWPTQ